MNHRENILRAVRFETPEYIPMTFHINAACWAHYPSDALQELMAGHPLLFPNFQPTAAKPTPALGPNQHAGQPYTDDWGCVWETTEDGITGTVTKHPLASWDDFDAYVPPDPETQTGLGPCNWSEIATGMEQARTEGRLCAGGLHHGHTFLRLCDLRGYENLLFDMADNAPQLPRLIQMVEDFNQSIVNRYIQLGVEWMSYPEDLGMQVGPMLSPNQFRQYIKPGYERLMAPARAAGCVVHMHSDGDIRSLVDDLIDGGVNLLNLQDLVNGIDWIADKFAGRVCLELDIDRQQITPYGTPDEIDALVREEVEKLGAKAGGLIMIYGLYPGVPLKNVKAVMDAMERYTAHYA